MSICKIKDFLRVMQGEKTEQYCTTTEDLLILIPSVIPCLSVCPLQKLHISTLLLFRLALIYHSPNLPHANDHPVTQLSFPWVF